LSLLFGLVLSVAIALAPVGASGQSSSEAPDTIRVVPGVNDVVGMARAAQAEFERRRLRHLPRVYETPGGRCDENVGRFCTWYGEGEWYPVPEAPEIIRMRNELVERLDELQRMAPDSDWILGQRVWYRAEGEDWDGALVAAQECRGAEPWWCRALEGFSLHGLGAHEAAEVAFEDALSLMDEERRTRWSVPRWPVDGDMRGLLDDARDDARELAAILTRLWTLADPLYLVRGNDRRTEHFSRWTVSELRKSARNPFRISWGDDLEQLVVRHGWEMGWERAPTRDFASVDNVIGHKHPEGRDYMPSGRAVETPAKADAEALRADRRRPRSLYAPEYAPVLLPMDAQIAVFPRVGEAVVVATQYLPEDTTFHATHDHALPWMEPGSQADSEDRIGLYLIRFDEADDSVATVTSTEGPRAPRRFGAERAGREVGALMLRAPGGKYVLSSESWSPRRRRAGRIRTGLELRTAVEGVATLSDFLLLRTGEDPQSLESAVDLALPSRIVGGDETFAVSWEVAGLGFRPETLEFEIAVERTGRSVFRRVGEFLRVSDRPQSMGLSWQEPAASRPGPSFHVVDLDLPPLEPGRYEIRLVLRTADRSDTERTLEFVVEERGR
jgi:hypothetical protein